MKNYFADKSIRYHPAVHESFDYWAFECGCDPQTLKQATKQAIRSRHHAATIEHESHQTHGNQPDIFSLSLGSACIFYTVERKQVLIRGYGWEIDHAPLDDGELYAEASW